MNNGKILVQKVVSHLRYKKLLLLNRADADIEDYLQVGYLGYLNALKTHKEEKGNFERYAWIRIRGTILDWNRTLAGRARFPPPLYVEDLGFNGVGWDLPDMKSPTAEQQLISGENREYLTKGIQQLRQAHQHVLSQYYFKHKTMKQIGEEVGLTESRICQIHDAALNSFRKVLKVKRKEKKKMETEVSKKRQVFDLLVNNYLEGDGDGRHAPSLFIAQKLSINEQTVKLYLDEFHKFSSNISKHINSDGHPVYAYTPTPGVGSEDIYTQIKEAANKSRKPRKRKVVDIKKKETTLSFLPPKEESIKSAIVSAPIKIPIQEEKKIKQPLPNNEIIIKLRIQVQVEQI